MSATGRTRTSRTDDEEDVLKRPAPEAAPEETAGAPALPDLEGGRLEPDTWLALQQTIGNKAVGGLVERRRASQPLPPEARRDMEAAFNRDFGQVQIHSGPGVDEVAQSLGAAAFTVDQDVYVHSSVPPLEDTLGRQVLGEELAHVAQGVGRHGFSRVTAPGEAAEREAREAGASAAAGRQAEVAEAPEAAGAAARWSLAELEEEAKKRLGLGPKAEDAGSGSGPTSGVLEQGASAIAAAAEKAVAATELSEDEKNRLRGGAIGPLNVLTGRLEGLIRAAPGGKPSPKALQPLVDNSVGLSSFIMSFGSVPSIQPALQSAAVKVESGLRSLLAAIDPHKTLLGTATAMETTASTIRSLATAPAPAAAPGAPAPATDTSDTLTPAQAEQLRLGAADPLSSASAQLKGEDNDLELVTDRLKGLPGMLRSFTSPAGVAAQLNRQAMNVETYIRTLESIQGGTAVAVSNALADWNSATDLLFSLVTTPSGGGAAPAGSGQTGPGSGDEELKKPT